MFESKSGLLSAPEVIARFDEMFERHYPSKTPESAALVDRVRGWVRVENRAAAARMGRRREWNRLEAAYYSQRRRPAAG